MISPILLYSVFNIWLASSLQRSKKENLEARVISSENEKKLYKDYEDLITSYFLQCGLHNWLDQMTEDPWSPWLHYFVRKEKRKLFNLIPYQLNIAIAEVISEPEFVKGFFPGLQCAGLKIRIIDHDIKPVVIQFAKLYEEKFGEKAILI